MKKLFTESYARIVAMKLFAHRTADYLRAASDDDRRYLLFNPIVKMKVTGQGERVVGMLHEIIAARGYEQDTYFEMAIRDIGMLPKLEGTEHVNMALIIKFVKNYFFDPIDYPAIPTRSEPANDSYLFEQFTGGLARIQFPDYRLAYEGENSTNISIFRDQVELFKTLLIEAPPSNKQSRDIDYMLAAGELFTLIVYAQLILEKRDGYMVDDDLLEQIFIFLISDFSSYALKMVLGYENSTKQEEFFNEMIKKPNMDKDCFARVFKNQVLSLKDCYRMQP